jgi:peptidoglycan/LPS O-acetylase OafA/YrhL
MKKISSVELLRFVSSLMVLIWHYQQFYLPINFLSETQLLINGKSNQPFYDLLNLFYEYGHYGVEFFFIISGYVFALVYLSQAVKISGKKFFINRLARLYPLHILTLLIVLFLQLYSKESFSTFLIHVYNDFYHFILNLFFISGWGFEQGLSFNGPVWSVSVEIIIYFLFFLTLIKSKSFLVLKSVLIVLFFVLVKKLTNYGYLDGLNINVINCGILFFEGVLIYFINNKYNNKYLSCLIGLSLLFFSFYGNFKLFIFLPSVLLISLCFEIFLNDNLKKLFNFLGNLTYGLYLWHLPVQLFLILSIKYNNINFNIINNEFFFLSYIALVFSISTISYYFFEKKLRILIRAIF